MASFVGGVGKGTLKFGRILRLLCSSPLQSHPESLNGRQISVSSKVTKILNESSTIVQDGTTIGELPILIRRASRDTYPFSSHSYCGDKIRAETEFDMSFKEMLENCDSVSDVFNLLEVPSDKVQGHSAVYALQRLHVLMSLNTDWKQIHSFIRRAVIGELYHIVERDISLLSNFSLVTLVDCYFAAEGFSATCSEAVNKEISHRLVEGLFSIEELLSLVHSLRTGIRNTRNKLPRTSGDQSLDRNNVSSFGDESSENAIVHLSQASSSDSIDVSTQFSNSVSLEEEYLKYQELLQNVWVHLASRCDDMDENTIPWTMQLLPSDKKIFIPLLDKTLNHVWPLLTAETAGMCLDNLVRLRTHNSSMMTKLGHYAVINVHLMTPSVLLSYLHAFLHFSITDSNLIHVIEKCVTKTGTDTPTDLLTLCVEYLRSCKYVSPIIMDISANHFTKHWESYNPLEIYAMLRSFGYLNYLPSDPQDFLLKAEACLHKRFDVMEETQLLEALASLSFVTTLPKNLYKRVSSEYFFKKVGALKNPKRTIALMWLKIMKHASVMGFCSTCTDVHRNWLLKQTKRWLSYPYNDTNRFVVCSVVSALSELLGPGYHHVLPFYSCCAVYLDEKGVPIKLIKNEMGKLQPAETPAQRLVILLRGETHFTSNTQQLLGPQQQRKDHLKKLGYLPIEIRSAVFHFQAAVNVLRSHLADHIDFDSPGMVAHREGLQDRDEASPTDSCEAEEGSVEEGEEEEEGEVLGTVLGDLIAALHLNDGKQNNKRLSPLSPVTNKDQD